MEFQDLKTQKAVLESDLKNIKLEYSRIFSNLDLKTKEAEKSLSDFIECSTQKDGLLKEINELKLIYDKIKNSEFEKQQELQKCESEISRLNAELRFKQEKLETQKQEIEKIGEKFETEFKLLAQKILDDKADDFSKKQETGLKAILSPLKEQIQQFKSDFEIKYKTESDDRISLREQVKHMMELNQNLSQQANNLTQALSNNVKQQGDWGEEILESILEFAGLQKNIQYFVQQQTVNDGGEIIRPDIIVKYPDGRSVIIDSKVSLVHHTRLFSSTTEEESSLHLKQLINSIKVHIDGLSRKNYQDIAEALDFVIMFVPNEAAYITAMQADNELWQYAYKRRVMVISPTNLIPAMKLVADLWQKDDINRNSQEIADRAAKLYDKLSSFVENFEKVGEQIERANRSWEDARKQLHKGKGNLISQAEQMKMLKVKPSKKLPKNIVEDALLEDGVEIDENIPAD